MKNRILITSAAAAVLALSSAAFAQTSSTATVDLNVRSGPGPNFDVVGVIQANESVTVEGCIEGSLWCRVSHGGSTGWAYSQYLTADFGGSNVVIAEQRAEIGVPVVEHDSGSAGSAGAVGMVGGAIVGAVLGGPVGAVIGGAAGATTGSVTGAVIDPPSSAITYVRSNPVDQVYLDGEVVVGAGLPDTVALQTIPDYQYSYVYVNGVPVLVEPQSRQIVYVVR
jgi:uncharacterized protein YraI